MINVNQITSQLAGMELPELQNYAALHKNDPYIVSLAMSVANTKKQENIARDGMAGMQPQPKVVDQAIADIVPPVPMQMLAQHGIHPQHMAQQQLPENSGIGQLPAPNMQGMGHANGGIVGYADTGLVKSQLPGGLGILSQGAFGPQAGSAELEKRIAAIQSNPRMRSEDKANLIAQIKQEFFKTPAPAAVTPAAPPAAPPAVTPTVNTSAPPAVTNTPPGTPPAGGQPPAPTAANPYQLPPSLLTGSGQGIRTGPPAGLPSVASFADQLTGIDKFLPKKEAAPVEEDFMKKREEASAPVWAKFQNTIDKEKNRLNEGKEQDFYMALIEGGLEAASGKSPNGLQNLAAGFSKGAKSYGIALKDFRKAAQENSKMELDMERAKAAEKRGDMDAFQKAEDSIKNRNADIDKLKTSGIFALQNVNTSGAYQLESTRQHVAGTIAAHGMPTGTDAALLQKYAGKDGEMALKMLEAGSPEERAQAKMIRAKLQSALLTPMNAPIGGGPVRP